MINGFWSKVLSSLKSLASTALGLTSYSSIGSKHCHAPEATFASVSICFCVLLSYIFTKLSPLTRRLFPVADEASLRFLSEDNQRIEPEWYCPILPMVLVNGAEGIGTGYSTSIPNFDVRDVIRQMRRMMDGKEAEEIKPKYKGFNGIVAHVQPQRFVVYGRIGFLNETQLEITELPVRVGDSEFFQCSRNYLSNALPRFPLYSHRAPTCD